MSKLADDPHGRRSNACRTAFVPPALLAGNQPWRMATANVAHSQHSAQQQQQQHSARPPDAGVPPGLAPNASQPGLLGQLVTPPPGKRAHLCIACHHPITVYGRVTPCLHVFCMSCASSMGACLM